MNYRSKFLFLTVFSILACQSLVSQIQFGIKANYALSFNRSAEIKYDDDFDFLDYKVRFLEQDISPVFSGFITYKKDIIFLQGEVGYRTIKTRFSYINFRTFDNLDPQFETKINRSIIVPVQAGVFFDKFKFGVGPIFSFTVSENDIFTSIVDFEERQSSFDGGFRVGLGMELYRLHFDISFEQRFNGVAEDFYYRQDNKGFTNQSQFLNFGLGYLF